jgi:hypothetical protein
MPVCENCGQPRDPALLQYCSVKCQRAAVRRRKGKDDKTPRRRRRLDRKIEREYDDSENTDLVRSVTGRQLPREPAPRREVDPAYAKLGPDTRRPDAWMDSPYSANARAKARREQQERQPSAQLVTRSIYERQREDLGPVPPHVLHDYVAMQQWKAKRRAELSGESMDGAIDFSRVREDGTIPGYEPEPDSVVFLDANNQPVKWAREARWHDGLGEPEDLEAEMVDGNSIGWSR